MAWRSLVRSMEAGARRAELATRRRSRTSEIAKRQYEREKARFERRKAKLHAAERAADDVQRFEQYLRAIVELHKDCIDEWDWQDIASSQQPPPPALATETERAAQQQLDGYKPGLFARIFGRGPKQVSELTQAVESARLADARENTELLNRYREVVTTWDIERRIAKLVLAKDPAGYREALDYVDVLGEFGDFGSKASVASADPNIVVIDYALTNDETVPTEELELSITGKLLTKAMPAARHSEILQKHVCSAALRIARDVFNVIPVERMIVNVARTHSNSPAGHQVTDTIFSAMFFRRILNQFNLQAVDPVDTIRNFMHRMSFQKAGGFEPIAPLTES